MHDRTALAEAEVEYDMHTSPSIYVRYRLTSPPEAIDARLEGKRVSTIIWTTTPWTLPASLAVAFHPDFEYVALEQDGEVYIVAEALGAATQVACGSKALTRLPAFLVRAWSASPSPTRSSHGRSWGFWLPTSLPTRAPARCIRRRRTGLTTSLPVRAMD